MVNGGFDVQGFGFPNLSDLMVFFNYQEASKNEVREWFNTLASIVATLVTVIITPVATLLTLKAQQKSSAKALEEQRELTIASIQLQQKGALKQIHHEKLIEETHVRLEKIAKILSKLGPLTYEIDSAFETVKNKNHTSPWPGAHYSKILEHEQLKLELFFSLNPVLKHHNAFREKFDSIFSEESDQQYLDKINTLKTAYEDFYMDELEKFDY